MELLNLPRLRMKELQTVGENSIRICQAIPEVEPAVAKVRATMDDFLKGMQKHKTSAATKAELDKVRDQYVRGMVLNVQAESYYPHKGEKAQSINVLLKIATKYSSSTRLRYNEQTAAIDNMLDEMQKIEALETKHQNIARWLPLIEKANQDFKTATKDFIEGTAKLSNTSAASEVAPLLSENLHELYILMFAHAQIGTIKNIKTAYQELEVLIKSVN